MSRDLVAIGMKATYEGRLQELRKELSMSRTTMAGLIGVSAESLRRWETGQQGMKVDTALRIGHWILAVERTLSKHRDVDLSDLVPIVSVVAQEGVSQQKVMQWCRDGEMKYLDLGPLGWFVYRSEVPKLSVRESEAA